MVYRKLLVVFTLCWMLTACGGGSSHGGKQSVLVTPSLGKMTQVRIDIYKADGEAHLGSATISGEGHIAVSIGRYQGPVLAKLTALENATYFDEALGAFVQLEEGTTLHAIAGDASALAITPLTELAYHLALIHELFPLDASAVGMVNNTIRMVFAPYVNSILSAPTLLGDAGVGNLAEDEHGNYALTLAALALIAEGDESGRPAVATLTALTQDIVDGRIDGRAHDEEIANIPYSSFSADFNAALDEAASRYGYPGVTSTSSLNDMVLVLSEPESGNSTAEACEQTWQLADGLSYQLVYELTEFATGNKTRTSSDTSVAANVMFNGQQSYEANSTIELVSSLAPEQVYELNNLSYRSAATTDNGLLIHGFIESRAQDGFALNTVVKNTPSEHRRSDLRRWEDYNESFEQSWEQSVNGVPVMNSVTTVEYEMLYEGRETLIVPAGRFEACKFSVTSGPRREVLASGAVVESSGDEMLSEIWISVGSGLLLRRLVNQDEELLLAATIAGQVVSGN